MRGKNKNFLKYTSQYLYLYQARVAMTHVLHFKPETPAYVHFPAFIALIKTEPVCFSHSNKSPETIQDFAK